MPVYRTFYESRDEAIAGTNAAFAYLASSYKTAAVAAGLDGVTIASLDGSSSETAPPVVTVTVLAEPEYVPLAALPSSAARIVRVRMLVSTPGHAAETVVGYQPAIGAPGYYASGNAIATATGAATVPTGTTLTGPQGQRYVTTAPASAGGASDFGVPVLCLHVGSFGNVATGGVLIFDQPISNVNAHATAIDAFPIVASTAYPLTATRHLVGDTIAWAKSVERATDGRWSGAIYTLPLGT